MGVTSPVIKACNDCLHSRLDYDGMIKRCELSLVVNFEKGTMSNVNVRCQEAREDVNSCGPEARYFEAR